MTAEEVKKIEETIYGDLSPIEKAAQEMEGKLPIHERTLSDEAWRFFHFNTVDFSAVSRTVKLACQKHGWKKPELIHMDDFVRRVFPEGVKKSPADHQSIMERIGQIMSDYEDKGPVFIYVSYMDIKGSGEQSETDHTLNKLSSNLPNFLVMDAFAHFCSSERIAQFPRQQLDKTEESPGDAFSNRLFFVSYGSCCILPDNLRPALCTISYQSLDKEDCRRLLWEFHLRKERADIEELKAKANYSREIEELVLDDQLLEWYKNRISGLEEIQVRRLLASMDSAFASGRTNYADRDTVEKVIIAYKNGILKQHGRLVVKEVEKHGRNAVAGLDVLQDWLSRHANAVDDYSASSTGILLVGIPGTGKSATAKEVAYQFNLPLVQLDMSRILGGRVGDSERGMREMLDDLRFVAPCVLWIDEIEKNMSGAGSENGDGGVIKRLFGMLLTFIQENKKPVFTVTTANDIANLPPEFFRNGRFDGTFCLMMPDYNGCRDIMQLKLNDYGDMLGWKHTFTREEASAILNECVGTPAQPRFLTGADIEAHVRELYWRCRRDNLEGRLPELRYLTDLMRSVACDVRVQALPAAPYTMDDIASRYLYMIQKGLTMAGTRSDTYALANLNLDAVRYYSFDADTDRTGIPLCLRERESFKAYRNPEEIPRDLKPQQWYDARFFYELAAAMSKTLVFGKDALPETRHEYYKLMQHLAQKKNGRAQTAK